MHDKLQVQTIKQLNIATGHYGWAADEQGYYVSAPLSDDTLPVLIAEIEGLDGRVSPRELGEGTALVMHHDDAIEFIEREGRDRAHRSPSEPDQVLAFLNQHYPAFVWQRREESAAGKNDGGYVGSGYGLQDQEKLLARFRADRVSPALVNAPTNHDEDTHGIMLTEEQIMTLMQGKQQLAR